MQADNILSYELVSETSAACDGLQIKFICAESCVKIGKIIARRGGEKIFCGFADKQKSVLTDGGYIYVYARSGGSVLVDNEAIPCEYRHPTSKQLWLSCAEPFGIKFALPQGCFARLICRSKRQKLLCGDKRFYALYPRHGNLCFTGKRA